MVQTASSAFKEAVELGPSVRPQRPLLRFSDLVLTGDDISITSGGLEFRERFNEDTDLTIGTTPSSTLTVHISNPGKILSGYAFGKFYASIGATIYRGTYENPGNVTVVWNGQKTFTGHDISPYLTENGAACAAQPPFPVQSIVIVDNDAYLFGQDGQAYSFNLLNYAGSALDINQIATNALMRQKLDNIIARRTGIVILNDYQYESEFLRNGTYYTYEYVKLGTFIAPRPSVMIKNVIDLEANDQMTLFDDIWMRDTAVSFEMTLGTLLTNICVKAGVNLVSDSFINSDLHVASSYEELPEEFNEATAREVVGWIAEAAGSIARFNRDGALEITWFQSTDKTFSERNYTDYTPFSYSVQPINKLYVRNSDAASDVVFGTGENIYLIQDNPFLKNIQEMAIDDEVQSRAPNDAIYDQLSKFGQFSPSTADLFTDWTMQAGDIVSVSMDGNAYALPVYSMTMNWNGAPKITAESTGNEHREPPPKQERKEFETQQEVHELGSTVGGFSGSIDGINKEIGDIKKDIEINTGNIQVNADAIKLKVEESLVIEAINKESGSVKISASKIELDGLVSAMDAQIQDIVNGTIQSYLTNTETLRCSYLHTAYFYIGDTQYSPKSKKLSDGTWIYYLGHD